eukprot:TRINITY_DN627_c0_g2_i2.p1 TRINITY_DN627_c0_g2~~TRINITY_DN627_c0_g2_i2.p1  ORF type:complete len:277 (-),score=50.88 TRINITY_DN627_c0_g2_i2:151-981(-)
MGGRFFVGTVTDRELRLLLWHGPSGNKLQVFKLKSQWIQTCAFRSLGADQGICASGGMDNICTLWNVRDNGKPMAELEGHDKFISSCKFLDDKVLLTASADATVRSWDVPSKQTVGSYYFETGATSISVSKQSDKFLVGLAGGDVCLCDPKKGAGVATFYTHEQSIGCVAFFPNDYAFGTASDDLTCGLFDIRTAENRLMNYTVDDVVELNSIDFSLSGRFMFAAYNDMIRVWDVTGGAVVYELSQPSKTSAVGVNCDGTALCSARGDNEGRVWCL